MSNYPATEKGKLLHIEEVLFQTQVPSARGFGELEGFRMKFQCWGFLSVRDPLNNLWTLKIASTKICHGAVGSQSPL